MKGVLILVLLLGPLLFGCRNNSNNIDTIAIVTPRSFKGKIIIFFNQDSSFGDVRLINGKYFFYVKDDGIFSTTLSVGKGTIENYLDLGDKLERVYYESPMTIGNAQDTSYQVIGGSYRGIEHAMLDKSKSKLVNFLPFQADLAKSLKLNWEINDRTVDSIYSSKFNQRQPN